MSCLILYGRSNDGINRQSSTETLRVCPEKYHKEHIKKRRGFPPKSLPRPSVSLLSFISRGKLSHAFDGRGREGEEEKWGRGGEEGQQRFLSVFPRSFRSRSWIIVFLFKFLHMCFYEDNNLSIPLFYHNVLKAKLAVVYGLSLF